MTWVAVGVGVVGAVGGAVSSNSAAGKQKAATNAALAEQQRQYDVTRADNQPALQARNDAIGQMQYLAGKFGTSVPSAADVMGTPGYQFGLSQGQNALQTGAAASGGLLSGAAQKRLAEFGTDYGTMKYQQSFDNLNTTQNNAFNRYASIAGQGQLGAQLTAGAGQNMANQNAALYSGLGNSLGANAIQQGNIWQNGLNQAGSALQGYNWGGGSGANGGYSWFSDDGNSLRPRGGAADGGPITNERFPRQEPVVGTRAPVRTGGGGALSPNALLQLVMAQQAPQPMPMQGGIGQLVANPLTDPRAILDARMRAAGAYADGGPIQGPGGPQEDAIPIMASNNEHMFDAESVAGAGGGDYAQGHMVLNQLRALLKGGNHAG